MDTKQFDDLIKDLGSTRLTRATALRGFLAGVATAVAGAAILSEDADAKKSSKKNKRRRVKATARAKGGGNVDCPPGPNNSPRINAEDLWGDPLVDGCTQVSFDVYKDDGTKECTCWVEACLTDGGKGFYYGAATTCTVASVIVKGGSNEANSYSSGQCTEASPCYPPLNNGGKVPQISNITFCGLGCPPPPPDGLCLHSTPSDPYPGCMPACTAAGCTGKQCGVICGTGQSTGACPVGQGDDNPCCNTGYCVTANYSSAGGVCTYNGPTSGCPA